MAIIAKKGDSFERDLIPAGNYIARCYKMLEIGTVEGQYMGEKTHQYKVRLGWEMPLELRVFNPEKGEQPLVIDKEYTLSMGDKANLRKDLASWRGAGFTEEEAEKFDITVLVGKACMLNVIHVNGKKDPSKVYQQISGITSIPKGVTCPAQINPSQILSYDTFDETLFKSLPDFLRSMIESTPEYKAMRNPQDYEFVDDHGQLIPQPPDDLLADPDEILPF